MSRGIVMETGAKFVVVLMPDGQFRKVRTSRKPQIGEEFNFTEQRRLQNPRKLYSASAGAAAILLLLFVPFLVNFWSNNHPIVAYMTMDVNPSIELGVTKDEKVVELRAINDDGADVTKGLEYKGLPLAEVTEAIMDRISAGPYLNSGEGDVIITSVLVGKDQAPDYELNVTSHMDEAVHKSLEKTDKGRSLQVAVTTLSAPVEVRDEAKNDGLSAGKMAFYLIAKKKGYDISLHQLKTESIHQAAKPMGGVAAVVNDDTPPKKTDAAKTTAKAGDDQSVKDQPKSTGKDDKPGSSEPGASSVATGADAKAKQEKLEKLREAQKEQLKELVKKEQEKRLKHEIEKAANRGKGNDNKPGKGCCSSQSGGDWRDNDKKNEDKKGDGGKTSSSGAHSLGRDNDHRGGNDDNGNGKKQDKQHSGQQGGQEDAKNTSYGRPSGVQGHDSIPSGWGKNNGQNWNNGQVESGSASGGSKGSDKGGKQQSQTQGKTDDRDGKDNGNGKSDDKDNGRNGKDDKGNGQSSRDDNEDRNHSSGRGQQDDSRKGRG
ncbi:anti-sigma factor-like protein [Paenibacillus taihuensis]|uniref:Anti-sigma factor-like protein n=1 Tax=Paenibacillus taihuensis TaxID=1156355 RepID=A0A3D9S9S0_9BACL|nr:anti-sigma factor domain-containing protein [Paenibacillus taihuensis]REE85182.1 anti-sigma factor-like protein [Paenibacillus taihuensis]